MVGLAFLLFEEGGVCRRADTNQVTALSASNPLYPAEKPPIPLKTGPCSAPSRKSQEQIKGTSKHSAAACAENSVTLIRVLIWTGQGKFEAHGQISPIFTRWSVRGWSRQTARSLRTDDFF